MPRQLVAPLAWQQLLKELACAVVAPLAVLSLEQLCEPRELAVPQPLMVKRPRRESIGDASA